MSFDDLLNVFSVKGQSGHPEQRGVNGINNANITTIQFIFDIYAKIKTHSGLLHFHF